MVGKAMIVASMIAVVHGVIMGDMEGEGMGIVVVEADPCTVTIYIVVVGVAGTADENPQF